MDVTPYIDTIDPKARDANTAEREFYLRWLARSRGLCLSPDARFAAQGVFDCNALVLEMPGYGQSQTVTCEILDDGGNVVRTLPLPVDKSGKLPMTAAQVKEWTGITPARKTRAKASPAAATVSPDLLARLEAVEAENARLRADLAGARAEAAALARRLEGKRAARFAGAALMAPPVPSLVLAR